MADQSKEIELRFTETGLDAAHQKARQLEQTVDRINDKAGTKSGAPATTGRSNIVDKQIDDSRNEIIQALRESRRKLEAAEASGDRINAARLRRAFTSNADVAQLVGALHPDDPLLIAPQTYQQRRETQRGMSAELAAANRRSRTEVRDRLLEDSRRTGVIRGQERQFRGLVNDNLALSRVPEQDRPFVESQANRLERSLMLEKSAAIRESIRLYNEDNKSFSDYLNNEKRTRRDRVQATRRGVSTEAAIFQESIAHMSPGQQYKAIGQRMQAIGGGRPPGGGPPMPPGPDDPYFNEWNSLSRQRPNAWRNSTMGKFLSRPSGMGLFMNAMFGGWEVFSAMQPAMAAANGRAAGVSSQRQLELELATIDKTSSGILGSFANAIVDPYGQRRAGIEAVAGSAALQDRRTEERYQRIAVRDTRMEALRVAGMSSRGIGQFDRQIAESESVYNQMVRQADAEHRARQRQDEKDLDTYLQAQAADVDQRRSEYISKRRSENAQRGIYTSKDDLAAEFDKRETDDNYREEARMRNARTAAINEAKYLADLERRQRDYTIASERARYTRTGMMEARATLLEGAGDILGASRLRLGGAINEANAMRDPVALAQATANQQAFQIQWARQNAATEMGLRYDVATRTAMNRGQPLTATMLGLQNERNDAMQSLAGRNDPAAIAQRGWIEARMQFGQQQARENFQAQTRLRDAYTRGRGYQGEMGELGRLLQYATDPDERDDVLSQINSLGTSRMQQIQDMNRNVAFRRQQFDILNERGSNYATRGVRASVADMVAQTRDEEMALRVAGMGPQADEVLRLGRDRLTAYERQYSENFSQANIDPRMNSYVFSDRYATNPADIFEELDRAKEELSEPGKTAAESMERLMNKYIPQLAQSIAKELANLIA